MFVFQLVENIVQSFYQCIVEDVYRYIYEVFERFEKCCCDEDVKFDCLIVQIKEFFIVVVLLVVVQFQVFKDFGILREQVYQLS